MANKFDPVSAGHPEFVAPIEVEQVRLEVDIAKMAWAQEHAHSLRLAVANTLQELDAFNSGMGWAVYDLSEDEEGAVAMVNSSIARHILLFSFMAPMGRFVKIVTNEIFNTETDGVGVIAEQVFIDNNLRCHYGLHGGQYDPTEGKLNSDFFPNFQVGPDEKLCTANDGQLVGYIPIRAFDRDGSYTTTDSLQRIDHDAVVISHFQSPEDALFCVGRGFELLAEAKSGSLRAQSHA